MQSSALLTRIQQVTVAMGTLMKFIHRSNILSANQGHVKFSVGMHLKQAHLQEIQTWQLPNLRPNMLPQLTV